MRKSLDRSVPRTHTPVEMRRPARFRSACGLFVAQAWVLVPGLEVPVHAGIPEESPALAQQLRAQELTAQGKWAEAIEPLQEHARANPSRTRSVIDLSRALLMTGNRNEAIAVLINAAGSRGPKDRAALIRRINALTRLFKGNANFQ
ncbi:MAG: BTAD domain-containing putative transcriptional regulator, partial [Bdellovibrionota bacterium]